MFELRLEHSFDCGVCREKITEEEQTEAAQMATLFGLASKYMVCPCCKQRVPEYRDRSYQNRARRWAKKHGGWSTLTS